MPEIIPLTKNWNGKDLRQVIKFKDMRFRIVTGLRNGGGEDCVYMLGDTGWKFFICKHDIDTSSMNGNRTDRVSYVSDEKERRAYAEELNRLLKLAIVKIFNN